MPRQVASFSFMIIGVLLITLGFSFAASPQAASAMPNLQPSPRPTLEPTSDPDRGPAPTPTPSGRITGTIINLTTGAPTAGLTVDINGARVSSDRNGNYELDKLEGVYQVTLLIPPGQGTPAQGTLTVEVGRGDTVVVHLFFYGPATPTPLPPTPTDMPIATPVPTVVIEPPAGGVPPSLPNTSVDPAPAPKPAVRPARLPVTAASTFGVPTLWVVLGFILLAFGLVLQVMPRHHARRTAATRRARERDYLATLLKREPEVKRSSTEHDQMLRSLLDKDPE